MIFKVIFLSIAVMVSLFAKTDFTKFQDICDHKKGRKCHNRAYQIRAVQSLLHKKFRSSIKVNGKWTKQTKRAVIAFQRRNALAPTGYIGKKTKLALNRLYRAKSKKALKRAKGHKLKRVARRSSKKANLGNYSKFIHSVNLKKSYAVYKNLQLIRVAKRAKTLLKVDIHKQRIKLLVNGKVALDAPCTTGAKRKLEPNSRTIRDKHTPTGTFKILEKVALKRSTIFGDIYRNGRHIYHGDRRKYRGSWRGARFVGHPLEHWMRLTSSGIGLHASNSIKRYPASNGCIRLPKKVAHTLFASVKRGTTVRVVN